VVNKRAEAFYAGIGNAIRSAKSPYSLTGFVACELVEDIYNFASSYIANCDNLLTEQQKGALDDLQARLDEIARGPDYECWNNEAILSGQAWDDARDLAKHALNCFGWSTEAPPQR
jgi:hypothetical protein